MLELATREEMQREEKEACEQYGVSTLLLMENAGRGIASEILSILRDRRGFRGVSIVCGTGNNGGDGMVVARHLLVEGIVPRVYLVGSPEALRGDARYNYEVLLRLGFSVCVVASSSDFVVEPGTLIVDALFGTGLTREVVGLHREIIQRINAAEGTFVVAVDVPSGVDASDGRVLGEAVRAHLTVTLGLVKRGLVLFPGRAYVGNLKLCPIGIPLRGHGGKLILASDVRRLLPRRPWFAHKISAGVVGIIAGSSGMLGAGILAALGAYRSGAGMVVWPLPPELSVTVKACIPEVVSVLLSSSFLPWCYSLGDLEAVTSGFEVRKVSSVVVGPGLGVNERVEEFLEKFLAFAPVKGVLDADGLNIVARNRERWKERLTGWVVTPHLGEAARLLGWSFQEVSERKVEAAQEIARSFGCVTVLKGPGTLIASPQGEIFVNPTGNELLATAGSGDVLAGLIGGYLAQGLDPLSGALCGVFLHGLVADLLQKEGRTSLLAHEIAEHVDAARKVVDDGTWRFALLDGNFFGEFGA
ncbi:MAG: NAD(P)H-hydrate dehydratase [Candidatus Caldatribacterium sp.]|uniref:NAD(P)H-hydrate dehydratase n=1 Tax=Candidatus Caldatribacterium sp. TaxID=2282143 RepID=UPI0037EC9870|nr:NAD(P)H-hydrate dehydratase [Candidatus Caldatribacterium sp.]MCX7731389.1 NAD(P)H-hydrate dehydratase [Candidatus Caldatribacterium sp.]